MDKALRLARLQSALLYICLDSRRSAHAPYDTTACTDIARKALAGGVSIIQLRDKNSLAERTLGALTAEQTVIFAHALRAVCHSYGALFAINDNPHLAREIQADICHVGQTDMPIEHVRAIVGEHMLIGQSTHSLTQAQQALNHPEVDYFCLGPLWATPTKPGRAAIGCDTVTQFVATHQPHAYDKPWFAIGDINSSTIKHACQAGAQRFVVVRAIIDAPDPQLAAQDLYQQALQAQVSAL